MKHFARNSCSIAALQDQSTPGFADFANYHAGNRDKRCVSGQEALDSPQTVTVGTTGGHYVPITHKKNFDSILLAHHYKDAHDFVTRCDHL
ncbi:hypothetical protein Tco_0972278 [Tanacetum coccineum]